MNIILTRIIITCECKETFSLNVQVFQSERLTCPNCGYNFDIQILKNLISAIERKNQADMLLGQALDKFSEYTAAKTVKLE